MRDELYVIKFQIVNIFQRFSFSKLLRYFFTAKTLRRQVQIILI
jgi:hypothetical protein